MNSSEEFQNVDSTRVAILELIDKGKTKRLRWNPPKRFAAFFLTQQPISDRQSRENF